MSYTSAANSHDTGKIRKAICHTVLRCLTVLMWITVSENKYACREATLMIER